MNQQQKLNNLAVRAKNGCVTSKESIIAYYLKLINHLSLKHWYHLNDEAEFSACCIKRIEDAIRRFNPSKGTFDWQVKWRIRQALFAYTKRGTEARERLIYADAPIKGREEETVGDHIQDVLADVEKKMIAKERVALLAQGDSRRETVLNAWMSGSDNDSELSKLLAQLYGGKAESHRRFITRFRTECQRLLESEAV